MKELLEGLVFIMPLVAGIIGLLQIYILYVTLKLAANSIKDFRNNQIWIDNRKDAAQILNLLIILENEIDNLKRTSYINHDQREQYSSLIKRSTHSLFPELEIVVDYFIKFMRFKKEVPKIAAEIESLELKLWKGKKNTSAAYMKSLLILYKPCELVVAFDNNDLEEYEHIYSEQFDRQFQNFVDEALTKLADFTIEMKANYISFLHQKHPS